MEGWEEQALHFVIELERREEERNVDHQQAVVGHREAKDGEFELVEWFVLQFFRSEDNDDDRTAYDSWSHECYERDDTPFEVVVLDLASAPDNHEC